MARTTATPGPHQLDDVRDANARGDRQHERLALRKNIGERLHGARHILRLHREHHDVGAGHGFAIVGGDVHAEFIGERDAPLLVSLTDADVLWRRGRGR